MCHFVQDRKLRSMNITLYAFLTQPCFLSGLGSGTGELNNFFFGLSVDISLTLAKNCQKGKHNEYEENDLLDI